MRLIVLITILTRLANANDDNKQLKCDFSDTIWEPLQGIHLHTCDIFTQAINAEGYQISIDSHEAEKVEGLRFNDNRNLNYLPENIGKIFPNLQGLYGEKTYLTVINVNDLKGLKKLKYLNFASSDLKVIEEGTFADLVVLQELDLSDSDIRFIDVNAFRGLSALKTLYLGANKLSQLEAQTFAHLIALESISLELNHFESIDENLFASNSKLADIWLNGNKITSMSWQTFANLKSLSYVDVQNNPCIDGVYDTSNFDDLKTILDEKCATINIFEQKTEISIKEIKISKIREEYSIDENADDGYFSQHMKIVRGTDVVEWPVPDNDPTTKLIDCHTSNIHWRLSEKAVPTCEVKNQIIDTKDFKLSGTGNNLKAITFADNKHVKFLPKNLAKFAPNIVEFSAANTSLVLVTRKNFDDLRHLRSLNLANNNIRFIDPDAFDDLTSLEELDLSGNDMETIDEELFSNLKNLKVLRIGSNKLHEIPRKSLRSLRNLVNISLSHQYIADIDENVFKTNVKLQNVWMHSNKLKSISPNMFNNLKSLEYIDIRDNKCIDSVYEQSEFVTMKTDILAKCGSGYELKMGKKIEVKEKSKKKKPKKEQQQKKKKKERLPKNEDSGEEQREVTCEYDDIFWPHTNRTLRTCIINEAIDDPEYFLSANPQVVEEFVDTDKVEAITFVNNKNIKYLPQNIHEIFPNLIEMSVANSGISEIYSTTFKGMKKLKSLDMSGNEILSLAGNVFEDLIGLEFLSLDGNPLEQIDILTFTYLLRLKRLQMRGGKMENFNFNWFNELSNLYFFSFDISDSSQLTMDFYNSHPYLKYVSMNGKFYDKNLQIIDEPENVEFENSFGSDFSGIIEEEEEGEEAEIKEVECIYIDDTCSIEENIGNYHYIIKSSPKNSQIKKFSITNNQNVKFLPENLGSEFPILETLTIDNTAISTIRRKNFQNLPHLERLYLLRSKIKAIESNTFDDLSFLKEFSMIGNKIEIFEEGTFYKLKNLEKVDLSENHLHYVHPKTFKFLRKLRELTLNDNQLSVIDESAFKFNPRLERISFSGNKIESLNPKIFDILLKLKFVNLSGNNCIEGTFDESQLEVMKKKLKENCRSTGTSKEVFCEVNSEEDSEELCMIGEGQSIDEGGYIIAVDSETVEADKVLTLKFSKNKKIKFLPENVGEVFKNLQHFVASNLSLENLPENIFKNLDNLKTLDLSNNKLKEFNTNAFADLSPVEEINLSGNQITIIDDTTFEGLSSLRKIDLSENELTFVTPNAFKKLPNLESLIIDEGDNDEWFEEIEYSIIKRFKKKLITEDEEDDATTTDTPTIIKKDINCDLDHHQWNETYPLGILSCVIQNQPIAERDFKINSTPTTLYVEELKIENDKSVHFLPANFNEDFPKLLRIIAKNLSLEVIPRESFQNLINLSVIDLSHNNIKSLDRDLFRDLPNVEEIVLSGNEIEDLPEDIFTSLPSLKRIYLDGNKIRKLDKKIFENLPNLEKISINGNDIDYFDASDFPYVEIEHEIYGKARIIDITTKKTQLPDLKDIEEQIIVTRKPSTTRASNRRTTRRRLTTTTTTASPLREVNCDVTQKYSDRLNRQIFVCNLQHEIIDDPEIALSNNPYGNNIYLLTLDNNPNIKFLPDNIAHVLPNLIQLSAKKSAIESLLPGDFENLAKLEEIDLSENALRVIEPEIFDRLPNLKSLDLSANQIEFVDEDSFRTLPSLRNLRLQNNLISFIDPKTFEKLPNLEVLNIEGNMIPSMSEDAFRNNPRLREFKHNLKNYYRITTTTTMRAPTISVSSTRGRYSTISQGIFRTTTAATSLPRRPSQSEKKEIHCNFGNIFWTNSDSELFTCDLSHVIIDDPDIAIAHSPRNKRVKGLSFIDNKRIHFIPKDIAKNFLNLVEISAYNTSIQEVPSDSFENLPKLKSLNLMVSNIEKVHPQAFNDLVSLENLELSNNNIFQLAPETFQNNPNLKSLYLNNNKLTAIDVKLFERLPELRNISLENNEISSVNRKLFNRNYELMNVWLNGNRINYVDPITFDGKRSLEYVDFRGNECIDEFFVGVGVDGMRDRLKRNCAALRESYETTTRRFNEINYQATTTTSREQLIFSQTTKAMPIRFVATTISPLKTLNCRFAKPNRFETICLIENQSINDRGFIINSSPQDPTVTQLVIQSNKDVKFLPENIPKVFPNLINLSVQNNSLIEVFPSNFENLRRLKLLNLADNDLSIIDPEVFSKLPSLESLNLKSNHIDLIVKGNFYSMPLLKELDLSQNQISELNPKIFSKLPELREISVENNQISEIPEKLFENNGKLEKINLGANKINSIAPHTFDNLRRLKEVNLNEMECLSGIYRHGTLNAMKIDVKNNCALQGRDEVDHSQWGIVIPKVIEPKRPIDENLIQEVTRVPHREGIECQITEEFSKFSRTNLETCKIENGEKINSKWIIKDLPRTRRVKRFVVENNPKIHTFPTNLAEVFPELQEIEITNSSLKDIHPENFQNLRELKSLKLPGNSIKSIEANAFMTIPTLQNLDISNNHLQHVDENAFKNLPQLTNLNLSGNKLSHLPPRVLKNLPKLKTIDLANNDLNLIDEDTFKYNPQIYSIDASNNNLNSIDSNAFERLPHLINLDLTKNECIDRKFTPSTIKSLKAVIGEHCQSHKSLKNELKTCQRLVESCKRDIQAKPAEMRLSDDQEKLQNLLQKAEMEIGKMRMEVRALEGALSAEKNLHSNAIEEVRFLKAEVRGLRENCARVDENHNFLIDVHCNFNERGSTYECETKDLKINAENSTISSIKGDHKRGKRNSDVTELKIFNQNTKNLPNGIFKFFPNLRHLKIENSKLLKLTELPLQSLPHLTDLTIKRNNIHHIDPKSFADLLQLERLDLSHNFIKDLPTKVFERLPRLNELTLSDNMLTALPYDIIPKANNLRRFAAKNNQFRFIDPRIVRTLKEAEVIDLTNNNCIDSNYSGGSGDDEKIMRLIGEITLRCTDDNDDENEQFCSGRKFL